MNTIIIVRHGNTFHAGDTPRRIGRRTDLPLTGEGRDQATALGSFFADHGVRFTHALYGPLQRTATTTGLILAAQPAGVPAAPEAMLAEIDHGDDEGVSEALVAGRVGEAALRRWDEQGVAPPGWTVDRDQRIAWWRTLFASPPPAVVLAVTSNGAARFALLALEDQGARPATLKLRTGAFGRLQRPGSGLPLRCIEWDVRPPSGATVG